MSGSIYNTSSCGTAVHATRRLLNVHTAMNKSSTLLTAFLALLALPAAVLAGWTQLTDISSDHDLNDVFAVNQQTTVEADDDSLMLMSTDSSASPITPAAAQSEAVSSRQPARQDTLHIAVSALVGQGIEENEAAMITELLRSALAQDTHVLMLDRAGMEEILRQQGFAPDDCASDACAVEMGRQLGVSHIAVGTIGTAGSYTLLAIRVLDVATGEVAVNETSRTKGGMDQLVEHGVHHTARQLLGAMFEEPATQAAAAAAVDEPPPAPVTEPVPSPTAPSPAPPAVRKPAPSTEAKSRPTLSTPIGPLALYLQPLGFLQFGPIIGLEFGGGNSSAVIDIHWRYSALGFAYHSIATGYNDSLDPSTMGFGCGIRYLFPIRKSRHRPYVGGIIEYWQDSGMGNEGDFDQYEWEARGVIIAANGGFRWRPGVFTFSLGLDIGVAVDVYDEWWYTNPAAGDGGGDTDAMPFAMIEAAIGFEMRGAQ